MFMLENENNTAGNLFRNKFKNSLEDCTDTALICKLDFKRCCFPGKLLRTGPNGRL